LAPALTIVLAAMWVAAAFLGLAFGGLQTQAAVSGLGLAAGWGDPLRIGSSGLDIGIAGMVMGDGRHLCRSVW
jgi:hypothetical protein